jgi:hypothetical protein
MAIIVPAFELGIQIFPWGTEGVWLIRSVKERATIGERG